MSMPTDPPPHDELRALRARAYGPDADIQDDPVALARLQQLEAQERAATAPVEPSPSSAQPAEETVDAADPTPPDDVYPLDSFLAATAPAEGGGAPDAPAAQEDGIPPSEPGEDAVVTPATPWWRRRTPVWVASLVAAVLLGVTLTLSVQAVASGKVTTLAVDEDGAWPSNFGDQPPGGRLFDTFHGFSVMEYPQGFGGGDPSQVCVYVVSDDSGLGAVGCGSPPFAATASMSVVEASPKELREAFPVGTALQFVLDGDHVHVYAKAPGVVGPTP